MLTLHDSRGESIRPVLALFVVYAKASTAAEADQQTKRNESSFALPGPL